MDGTLLIARLLLAGVFAMAGLAKLIDPAGTRRGLTGFGVPDRFAGSLALALPSAASATVLQNGRFLEATGMLPTGWRVEAWAKDATDVMWEPAPSGKTGDSGLVRIVSHAANDPRPCQ